MECMFVYFCCHMTLPWNIYSIPYVTTFKPYNPIKSILHSNNELHEVFKNKVFLKSKRQPPNLKRLLTKAKFTKYIDNGCQCQVKKCKEPRCGLCKFITEGSSTYFKDKVLAKNVIYVIQCRGCNEQYIGETVNLRNRVTLHNQHIKHAELRKIPVSQHIAECSDPDPKYFIFPFYQMKTESFIKRKEMEKYFIRTLSPKLNSLHWYLIFLCLVLRHIMYIVFTTFSDKHFVTCNIFDGRKYLALRYVVSLDNRTPFYFHCDQMF